MDGVFVTQAGNLLALDNHALARSLGRLGERREVQTGVNGVFVVSAGNGRSIRTARC